MNKIHKRKGGRMGLFDFLKKPRTSSVKSGYPEPENQSAPFRGTLLPKDPVPPSPVQTKTSVDSNDSFVFLSFAPVKTDRWTCPECGTYNDKSLNRCVVCGSDKKEEIACFANGAEKR